MPDSWEDLKKKWSTQPEPGAIFAWLYGGYPKEGLNFCTKVSESGRTLLAIDLDGHINSKTAPVIDKGDNNTFNITADNGKLTCVAAGDWFKFVPSDELSGESYDFHTGGKLNWKDGHLSSFYSVEMGGSACYWNSEGYVNRKGDGNKLGARWRDTKRRGS
ncbi:hypothetical protein BU16DRAFT_532947 [Lophium mytilinum]|uniref:Uncharacterized protein n=1 Tax=Lophium mytilinum TaxID=390894 RepID=A0A6A6RFU1_9PEZI|nr:hypothetical protein BU16DRAFT_532947 [Lophium mytilinum]